MKLSLRSTTAVININMPLWYCCTCSLPDAILEASSIFAHCRFVNDDFIGADRCAGLTQRHHLYFRRFGSVPNRNIIGPDYLVEEPTTHFNNIKYFRPSS